MADLVFNIRPAAASDIRNLSSHQAHRTPDGFSRIAPERSHLNRILLGPVTQQEALDLLYDKENGPGVERPTAQAEAPYCQIVIGAGPEFFRPSKPKAEGTFENARVADFEREAMAWLRDTFGHDLVHVALHLDEVTPHLHALIAPTYERAARKPGRQKKGETDEAFEARKKEAAARPTIRTVSRSRHAILSQQGSYALLRRSLANRLAPLGIEYGEDRAIDAPAPRTTMEWVKEEALAAEIKLGTLQYRLSALQEATRNKEKVQEELSLAGSQLADLQERYRTLASSPLEVPRIPDPPLIGGRDAWRAEVQKILANYATSIDIQKKDVARQRREVDERIKVAERAERERGLRLQTRQDREAAQKALDAKMAKGEAAIAELSKITAERNRGAPTLAEVMNHLGFLKVERFDPKASGFWSKDVTTVIGLAGGDGWQLHRQEKQPRQGAGIANLLTLILGSAEKALAFLMRHFREGRVNAYLDEIARKPSQPDRLPSSPSPSSAAPSGGWERGPGM